MIMSRSFLIWHILEARAEIQKHFRSVFGSNENFKICFRDLLTLTGKDFTMILCYSATNLLFWHFVEKPNLKPGFNDVYLR